MHSDELHGLRSPREIDRLCKLFSEAIIRACPSLAVSNQADLLGAQVKGAVSYHVVLQLVHRLELVQDRALRRILYVQPDSGSSWQDPCAISALVVGLFRASRGGWPGGRVAVEGVAMRFFTLQFLSQPEPCFLVHGVVHLVGVGALDELFRLVEHHCALCGEVVASLHASGLVEALREVACLWIARLVVFGESIRVVQISG